MSEERGALGTLEKAISKNGGSRTGAFAGMIDNIDEMYLCVDDSNAGSVRSVLLSEQNVATIATGSHSSVMQINLTR